MEIFLCDSEGTIVPIWNNLNMILNQVSPIEFVQCMYDSLSYVTVQGYFTALFSDFIRCISGWCECCIWCTHRWCVVQFGGGEYCKVINIFDEVQFLLKSQFLGRLWCPLWLSGQCTVKCFLFAVSNPWISNLDLFAGS